MQHVKTNRTLNQILRVYRRSIALMDVNNTETTDHSLSTNTRSVFFCPKFPRFTWDLKNTTILWILVVIILIASAVTILLNLLVIIAIKRTKELQKPVNILLASLAVADLLAGAISMPLSATIDILILHQFSRQQICTLNSVLNKPMIFFVCSSSTYHLTAIAWERYVAIQKFIDYKAIVTKRLLQKLAIAAWLSSVFMPVIALTMAVVEVDREVVQMRLLYTGAGIVSLICLIAIGYFYTMVYLGVRKRKVNEISQVSARINAKLESKIAKTTALLTAALVCSFLPATGVTLLGNVYPVLATNSLFRVMEALVQLNSLASPILYSYRDRKIRNAVLQLLGMRKLHSSQPEAFAPRILKANESSGSAGQSKKSLAFMELEARPSSSTKYGRSQLCRKPRITRSASCDAAIFAERFHSLAKPHEIFLRRKLSAEI